MLLLSFFVTAVLAVCVSRRTMRDPSVYSYEPATSLAWHGMRFARTPQDLPSIHRWGSFVEVSQPPRASAQYFLRLRAAHASDERAPIDETTKANNAQITETGSSKGYRFLDVTKFLVRKITRKINDFTGETHYEFGDITRAVSRMAHRRVVKFTGKERYEIGDISKEIIRRVLDGEYKIDDIIFLCKVLLTMGAEFGPVARFLPAKVLLEMMSYSLKQEASEKLLRALATALDTRLKNSMDGDPEHQVGDVTKKAVLKFIEKDEYEFGDLSRTISAKIKKSNLSSADDELLQANAKLLAELDAWDKALQANAKQ